MSRGCLIRVLACAQDWLDAMAMDRAVLHSLWRDAFLGALVIVRVALKFEVPASHLARALGIYGSARHRSKIFAMEHWFVQALLARRMWGNM